MSENTLMEIKPDRTGPKNLAIILFLGSLLVLVYGYADLQAHRVGLNEAQVDTLLKTPNAQGGEPTTVEDYRAFEGEAREDRAFLIRAMSLLGNGLNESFCSGWLGNVSRWVSLLGTEGDADRNPNILNLTY